MFNICNKIFNDLNEKNGQNILALAEIDNR